MKKAILPAMIAALLATSAQAATVYDADGTTADVYGRMQFDIRDNGTGATDGVGSARMGFKAASFINSDVNAIAKGEWQIAAENSDNDKFSARHLYAGFDSAKMGTLIFGQTDTAFYQAVAATDIYNSFGYGAFNHVEDGRQEGQIIYAGDFAGVYVGASYQFKDENFTGSDAMGNATAMPLDDSYALTLGYNIADVAFYGGYHLQQFATAEDKENYALSASYALNDLYLAAVFAGSKQDNAADYQGYDLVASYYLADATKVYGGYTFQENTDTNTDTVDEVTLGAQYAFNNQLKTWIEYQADMISGNADEVRVALQYNF
ncbi:MAG TPA: porin [Psychromonas sp.]